MEVSIVSDNLINRYLVVHNYGGVYADADLLPQVPIDQWHYQFNDGKPAPSVIVGVEWNTKHDLQFLQWMLYGVKGHPLFYDVAKLVRTNFINELKTEKFLGIWIGAY